MIGALSPHSIPIALIPRDAVGPRMLSVACCGECGNAAGSPNARVCTRRDCGLSDRFVHERCNAA